MANGVNGNDGVKMKGVLPILKEKVGGVVDKLESTGIFDAAKEQAKKKVDTAKDILKGEYGVVGMVKNGVGETIEKTGELAKDVATGEYGLPGLIREMKKS